MEPVIIDAEAVEVVIPTEEVIITEETLPERTCNPDGEECETCQ